MDSQLKNQLEKKELELNALMEITKAINDNLPEEYLYRIFRFTLRANLKITKLALFVWDDGWSCKEHFGVETKIKACKIDDTLLAIKEPKRLNGASEAFTDFDFVIPVIHQSRTLAFVFLAGLNHEQAQTDNSKFIQALCNILIVAVENKKLVRNQLSQEAMRKELEIARDVQQFLFPDKLPKTDRLQLEASYLPHDRVGGDYYDYIPINAKQFLICVADVSGKGIPAALMMSNFQASLHTLLRQTSNLTEIVEALNYQVMENTKGENFITFFAGVYDLERHCMVYINAGHNPPVLLRNQEAIFLEEGTTVLGVMRQLPFVREGFIKDIPNFTLFCYTDGLTETSNENGDEFGTENMMAYLQNNHTKELPLIHQDMIVLLDTFKGKNSYRDDITMLSCRVRNS